VLGRAMGKLVMDKGASQHTLPLAARDQEAEPGRQAKLSAIPQRDRYRRSVGDGAQFRPQFRLNRGEKRARHWSRRGQDYSIEALTAAALRPDGPPTVLAPQFTNRAFRAQSRMRQARKNCVHQLLHAVFQRTEQRARRSIAAGHALACGQHPSAQAAMPGFHLGETRQHRPNAQSRGFAAIHPRKQRVGQPVHHLRAVMALHQRSHSFIGACWARRMEPLPRHAELGAQRK